MEVNISNLSEGNLEEAFQVVYQGLADQRRLSFESSVSTARRYRGHMGSKCSIGHLIPDDLYNPLLEGSLPLFNSFWDTLGLPTPSDKVLDFLEIIQESHDMADNIDDALSNLEENAKWQGWQLPK